MSVCMYVRKSCCIPYYRQQTWYSVKDNIGLRRYTMSSLQKWLYLYVCAFENMFYTLKVAITAYMIVIKPIIYQYLVELIPYKKISFVEPTEAAKLTFYFSLYLLYSFLRELL